MSYQSKYTGSQIDEGIEKASKALTTPETAPSAITIPAIDTNNEQTNLTLVNGLNVEGGKLRASGGRSVYEHNIIISGGAGTQRANLSFSVFNNSPEQFTDWASAVNALLGDNYDYWVEMPARGTAYDFDTATVGYDVSSDFSIYFVTSLTSNRTVDTIETVRFWGVRMAFTTVTVGTHSAGHRVTEVQTYDDFLLYPSDFEDYSFADIVRQIV